MSNGTRCQSGHPMGARCVANGRVCGLSGTRQLAFGQKVWTCCFVWRLADIPPANAVHAVVSNDGYWGNTCDAAHADVDDCRGSIRSKQIQRTGT